MAEFIVPIRLKLRLKDIDEDELEQYISDFQFGLSELFSSSDADDDHFEIDTCDIEWHRIQEV